MAPAVLQHPAGLKHHPDLSGGTGQVSPPYASLRGRGCIEDEDTVPSAPLMSLHAPTRWLVPARDPAALQTQGRA